MWKVEQRKEDELSLVCGNFVLDGVPNFDSAHRFIQMANDRHLEEHFNPNGKLTIVGAIIVDGIIAEIEEL